MTDSPFLKTINGRSNMKILKVIPYIIFMVILTTLFILLLVVTIGRHSHSQVSEVHLTPDAVYLAEPEERIRYADIDQLEWNDPDLIITTEWVTWQGKVSAADYFDLKSEWAEWLRTH